MSGFRVAAFIPAVIIQRFMLHLAVILDRAKRRPGLLKPFARGPDGIAARRAPAFAHPRFLQIGSASCRERVRQYVYISVVAVSLQKKNTLLYHQSTLPTSHTPPNH